MNFNRLNAFSAIPQWLAEQQTAYNDDRARVSPHTAGRQVSAQVAAKKRAAKKRKRMTAKRARRRHKYGGPRGNRHYRSIQT